MKTTRLKSPYVLLSQVQKHVTVNEDFANFDDACS